VDVTASGIGVVALLLTMQPAMATERGLADEVRAFAEDAPALARQIGERIFDNETDGRLDWLVYWGPGENHASLGIGHFIWYPEGEDGRFHESFPDLLAFLEDADVAVPSWLGPETDCPWPTRAAFLEAAGDPRLAELRGFLATTVAEQAAFLIERLARAVPGIIAAAAPSADVRAQLERVLRTSDGALSPGGLYALVDYNNFKGEGLDPAERYRGEGWGLLQVLETMAEEEGDGLEAFAASAASVLERRVALAPPKRREERWLPGWLHRVATYADADRITPDRGSIDLDAGGRVVLVDEAQ
jgi:hypothetical protein